MKYLNEALKKKVVSQVLCSSHTFFLLDYDGTLTPIVPKPEMARLLATTRKILEKLSKNPKFSVGIISGRTVNEIRTLVKFKNVIYAGNHGLELEGPNFNYTHAKAKEFIKILRKVKSKLQPLKKLFPGSFIEDKKITLTYHYRLVDSQLIEILQKAFIKEVSLWLRNKKIQILEAKKAWEVYPNFNWNKGTAVRWILLHENPESLPIYIGDDKTDEMAFKALNELGITIRVGFSRDSHAQYFVKDVNEVQRFLSFMAILSGAKS